MEARRGRNRSVVEHMWAELRMSFMQSHGPIRVLATAWSRKEEEEGEKNVHVNTCEVF